MFRVNTSCAALTFKAFSVRHPKQRAALITRHPSFSSQRFSKTSKFLSVPVIPATPAPGGTVSSCLPFWVPWTPTRWGHGKHRHICGIRRLHICSAALGHKGVSFPSPCGAWDNGRGSQEQAVFTTARVASTNERSKSTAPPTANCDLVYSTIGLKFFPIVHYL